MIILDKVTGKVYYGSGGFEVKVTAEFWRALKNQRIQFNDFDREAKVYFSYVRELNIDDEDFESIFKNIANSEIGRSVLEGRLPVSTIL